MIKNVVESMEEAMALGTLLSVQSHSSETKLDWLLSRTPTSQSQVSKYGPLLLREVPHHLLRPQLEAQLEQ